MYLGSIRSIYEKIFASMLLIGISPKINATYKIGDYFIKVSLLGKAISFGRDLSTKKATFSTEGKFLWIDAPGISMRFTDAHKLCLESFVGQRTSFCELQKYPCFEFEWTCTEEEGKIKSGDLVFARVDISRTEFVLYSKNQGGGYRNDCFAGDSLSELGLPEDIDKADALLNQPLEKSIDFDKRTEEIFEIIELREFIRVLETEAEKYA